METAKAITTIFSIIFIASHVQAQGSLTPPGAPAPTMKTLQQVEPRTIVTSLPYSINAPGSYYLTTNLVGVAGKTGITITASDVTVDLNGFALVGVPGSLAGILVSGSRNNIEVRNGTIRDWLRSGVDAAGAGNSIFNDLRVYSNGWAGLFDPAGYGLKIGNGSLVQGCVASANNLGGIYIGSGGTVSGCSAQNNNGGGITTGAGGTIGGCTAQGNTGGGITTGTGSTIDRCTTQGNVGDGISAGPGNTVGGCTAQNNTGNGINAGDHCTVVGCTSAVNAKDGIKATQACFLRDNTCRQNGVQDGAGIHATGNDNRIEGNHLRGGTRGLDIDGTGNHVANNTVLNNNDNYDLAAGNQLNLLLCEVPETLDWPCSAKLAGTLTCSQAGTNGITVTADDVTIDLDGHALIGPGAASGSGIYQTSTLRNLTALNGKVSGWRGGGEGGIYATGTGNYIHGIQATTNHLSISSGVSSLIKDCAAVDNNYGIEADAGSTISDCLASGNVGAGIQAQDGSTVNNCVAQGNSVGYNILGAGVSVIGCTAYANADSGIFAYDACSVIDCIAAENGGDGIGCYYSGNTVKGCTARRNTGDGIRVGDNCFVVDNNCAHNGVAGVASGIHATGSDNRIEGNTVTVNDRGIKVDDNGNFIVRNTASGNGAANYDISINNKVGVIVSAPDSGVIYGSTGGAGVGSTDPWANFSY